MLQNKSFLVLVLIFIFICSGKFYSQTEDESSKLHKMNIGGPRLGVTYVLGSGELYENLKANQIGRLISQFGWHFEYQVTPKYGNGPSFVVQFVPLIGGVEYGTAIPSLTLAFGIRFPDGIEFGMGPNLIATNQGIASSLVLVGGKSFDYGGVSIPINIAYILNPKGNRLSLIFGYALD